MAEPHVYRAWVDENDVGNTCCLESRDDPKIHIQTDPIDHPSYYGGDTTYEAIKVIEAWDLGFRLGNTLKYISRAGKKDDDALRDLKKAAWYLNREIESRERG